MLLQNGGNWKKINPNKMDEIVNKSWPDAKEQDTFFANWAKNPGERVLIEQFAPKLPEDNSEKGKRLPFWIKNNFRFNISRSEYPRAFKTCESKEKYFSNSVA